MPSVGASLRDLSPQWLALLAIIRISTVGIAVALLVVHRVTDRDDDLILVAVVYTVLAVLAVRRWPRLLMSPAVWAVDAAVILGLVIASEDWRSPFYLLALTTLAIPAAAVRPVRALAVGVAFSAVYAVVVALIGPTALGAQTTVETLATHLLLPILLAFGVSYAADAVRRLRAEQERGERLAVETERRRIAWELHDSAKQRIHAAHLVLGAVPVNGDARAQGAVAQVLEELRGAAADLDTSVAELRSPLEGRPLGVALRQRASELSAAGPQIEVTGDLPQLEMLQAAHAYRVAAEALTNAVRHADAERVLVRLEADSGVARVVVTDNGRGLPEIPRPGSNGLRAMQNRARSIDGELAIAAGDGGRGTRVELSFPLRPPPKEEP